MFGRGQQRHELVGGHLQVGREDARDLRDATGGELGLVAHDQRRVGGDGHRGLGRRQDRAVAVGDLAARGQQRERPGEGVDRVGGVAGRVEALELQQPAGAEREAHRHDHEHDVQPAVGRAERHADRGERRPRAAGGGRPASPAAPARPSFGVRRTAGSGRERARSRGAVAQDPLARGGAPRPRGGRGGGWPAGRRSRPRGPYGRRGRCARAAGCGRRCGIGGPLSGRRASAAVRCWWSGWSSSGRGSGSRGGLLGGLRRLGRGLRRGAGRGQLLAGTRLEVAHLGPLGGLRVALDGAVGQPRNAAWTLGRMTLLVRLLRQRDGRGDGLQLRLEVILHIRQLAGLAVESARLELLVLQRRVEQQEPGHAQAEGRDQHDEEGQPRHPAPRRGQRPQGRAGRLLAGPGARASGSSSGAAWRALMRPPPRIGSCGVRDGGRRCARRRAAGRTRRAGWGRPRPRSGAARPW